MKLIPNRHMGWAGIASLLLLQNTSTWASSNIYVMDVQLVPAVCSLYPEHAKKRKCLEGYSLNISGLFPEKVSSDCSSATTAKLPPLQAKVIARVMPDEPEREALWRNIGGCMPMNASQYFRNIINYADRLKVPSELNEQVSVYMPIDNLKVKLLKVNTQLPANGLRFNCHQTHEGSLLTSIKVCYSGTGKYANCPVNVVNTCPKNVTIKGTY